MIQLVQDSTPIPFLHLTGNRIDGIVLVRSFQAILWITFGLALVRLLGLLWYILGETFFRLGRLCSRGRK